MRSIVPLLGFCILLFLGCKGDSTQDNIAASSDVPDLEKEITTFFERHKQIQGVERIVKTPVTETEKATWDVFQTDTLYDQLSSFAWNQKERAGQFAVRDTSLKDYPCKVFTPIAKNQINYIAICREGDDVVYAEARKLINSMLNDMTQVVRFQPNQSYNLQASFVDKLGRDSFLIETSYVWNLN